MSKPEGTSKIAILGVGNIGRAIAAGLIDAGCYEAGSVILTRRHVDKLDDLAGRGFRTTDDNVAAVDEADVVVVAVEPGQLDDLLTEIGPRLDPARHLLVSVVSGASISAMESRIGSRGLAIVRAMPNTAIALRQSMTCLSSNASQPDALDRARRIFDAVGATLVIEEEQMIPATALCACGIAFFLRAIRAAAQGGIEIGFHPAEAVRMAAQTALGAASLVLQGTSHPEREIDSVTTPRGCTISGLNEMEHQGFSSAMIKGITTSARKAASLY